MIDRQVGFGVWMIAGLVALTATAVFIFAGPVHAATLLDSTPYETASVPYQFIQGPGTYSCGSNKMLALSFDYVTSTQVEITRMHFSTFLLNTTKPLCAAWTNESGAGGYGCGTTPGAASTTIAWAAGQHPYAYPYGTPIRFTFYDATTLNSSSEEIAPYVTTGGVAAALFSEVQNIQSLCGDANGFSSTYLDPATYGIPSMTLYGGTLAFTPALSLPVTSTSITATCPAFSIYTPLCDALVWAFFPSATIQQNYVDEVAKLKTKVPWGWWSQLSTGISSVSSTDVATTTALTMKVPHGGTTTTVAIFDIQAARALIPDNVLDLIRTLGGVALWGLFGMWVWSLVTGSTPSSDV